MTSRKAVVILSGIMFAVASGLTAARAHGPSGAASSMGEANEMRFVNIAAKTRDERTAIANRGVSLEAFRSDGVWGFATRGMLRELRKDGFKILSEHDFSVGRGGHENLGLLDFPAKDSRFHNYDELKAELEGLATRNADIVKIGSIGKSLEGRDLISLHINTSPEALASGTSTKPGFIVLGAHHAREHLSVEIPLMFAQHLLANRQDPKIAALLDSRDIWIVPMVNPDGAEFDIATGRYKMWRKNRRDNGNGTIGVDLNRNYGYKWGTGGSSNDGSSDVYMGPTPFSEPETQAVKAFVEAHLNAKVLLTVHTFSELILYPWGHKYDDVEKPEDRAVFEKMAKTMAAWNKYTPQPASDLYIASGDTCDWAYGEHGIFAFTFELSPSSMWGGGFYPGQGVIDKVFNDNLKPLLYMLDVAGDPYQVTRGSGLLKNYVEPAMPLELASKTHPY